MGGLDEVGGNCGNYLKKGVQQKRGEWKQRFIKGGQAGSKGSALKKGGGRTMLYDNPFETNED